MIGTVLDHLDVFARKYMPSGKAWDAKNVDGTVLRRIVSAFTYEFYLADISIHEFIDEIMPDTTTNYISRWEKILRIPDNCFPLASTIEERRNVIKYKMAQLNLQTRADFESFATSLGISVKVRSGIDHDATNGYGTELPDITFGSAKEARFTIVVTALDAPVAFTYDFDFPFQSIEEALMRCIFELAKPANCSIVFTSE